MSNSNDSKEPLYHQQLKESLDDSSKQTTVAAPEAPSLPYCHQQLRESHDTHVPSSSSHAPSDHHPIREHQQSTGGWNPHGPPYYTSDPPNNAGVLSAGTYHSHNDIRSQQSHPPHGMGSKFHQHNMAPPPPGAAHRGISVCNSTRPTTRLRVINILSPIILTCTPSASIIKCNRVFRHTHTILRHRSVLVTLTLKTSII